MPKNKPIIILNCSGGIIDKIVSNTDITVYIFDEDIFECDLDTPEYSEDRVVRDVEVLTPKKFSKFLEKTKEEWDTEMDHHPSFNNH